MLKGIVKKKLRAAQGEKTNRLIDMVSLGVKKYIYIYMNFINLAKEKQKRRLCVRLKRDCCKENLISLYTSLDTETK